MRAAAPSVVMDCDFEHPPELIPDLVKEQRNGFKVVAAHRLDEQGPTCRISSG